jgi:2-oxoisovalerate dehydrogenase E2 component (dihydrolipoyl transacylase)
MSSICRMRRLLRPSALPRALSSSAQCNRQTRSFNDFSGRTFVPKPIILQHQSQYRFKSALPVIDDAALTPFLLADIGEGIAEVELLQWYVEPGATVHQFDRICQVQSDKASVEITSRYDGIVRELCADVGGVLKVGEPLCFMETDQGSSGQETLHNVDEGERLSVPSVASDYSGLYEEESFVSDDVPDAVSSSDDRFTSSSPKVMSSPAVRKLGKEHGIDISTIKGSGPNGRVLKSDVLKMIEPGGAVLDTAKNTTPANNVNAKVAAVPITTSQEDEIIPIRGYHRLMVKSMTSSLSVPHMVYTDEINVTSLQELRSQLKPICAEKGLKLTLLPFFLKAASLALNQYPVVNGSIDMEKMELIVHKRHDLGVAVDTSKGLVVVVVRGCEKRSVEEIAVELGRLFALVSNDCFLFS